MIKETKKKRKQKEREQKLIINKHQFIKNCVNNIHKKKHMKKKIYLK